MSRVGRVGFEFVEKKLLAFMDPFSLMTHNNENINWTSFTKGQEKVVSHVAIETTPFPFPFMHNCGKGPCANSFLANHVLSRKANCGNFVNKSLYPSPRIPNDFCSASEGAVSTSTMNNSGRMI